MDRRDAAAKAEAARMTSSIVEAGQSDRCSGSVLRRQAGTNRFERDRSPFRRPVRVVKAATRDAVFMMTLARVSNAVAAPVSIVGSHSIPDLRIESKQELSGFDLMTSRTPSSLETGFSGVLFIENWIFRMIPPSFAAATAGAWCTCTSSWSELLVGHRREGRPEYPSEGRRNESRSLR